MTGHTKTRDEDLILSGLDGSNPLAFLAALGTLRSLSLAWPERKLKMCWRQHVGAWRAVLEIAEDGSPSQSECIDALLAHLVNRLEDHPLKQLQKGNVATEDRSFLHSYWTSAIRSDLAPEATSQLQTVRRDYFVGNLEKIMGSTTKEHLRRTLFLQWDYADALDNQSLHLDPTEDRRHAYQWSKPSGDPARKKSGGMLGANRLAVEALPLFQAFASGDRLMTCGFHGTRANNTRWTWPIWTGPLDCDVTTSLLAMTHLQDDSPDTKALTAVGLGTAYRCRRILVGKTPNFTPAVALF